MYTIDTIVQLLKIQGKKQIDLANHLKLKKAAISEWKSGRNSSYNKYLPKIAEFFNVPIEFFVENTAIDKPNEIIFDDFIFKIFSLTKNFSEEDKKTLFEYAQFLNNRNKK